MGIKKKGLWSIIALVLAVLTVAAVLSQSGGVSPAELVGMIRSADPMWLVLAVICMLGMTFFEGEAVRTILKGIGYSRPVHRGFLYAAADAYFSAITPSASGGQPASAFFMIADGVPAVLTTAVLVLNVMLYTSAVLVLTWFSIAFHPQLFWSFTVPARVLIIAGTCALAGLTVLFYLLLKHQRILFWIVDKLVRLFSHVRLIRHPEKLMVKLEKAEHDYQQCVLIMHGKRGMVLHAFVCNLLQRLSQFLVTVCVYMATGGRFGMLRDLFITQCMITLGSNCVPIPGGMGVADFLMLDGFTSLFNREYAFKLELLGRSLSFYIYTLVGAVTTLIGYMALRRREKKERVTK